MVFSAAFDGALAKADAISLRTPYQSDPVLRARFNAGKNLLLQHAPVADAATDMLHFLGVCPKNSLSL
jgi:hypothetical protein